MKRLLALFLIALAGCKPAEKNDFPPRPAGSGRLFAVSFMTLNNPFFLDLNDGDAIKVLGSYPTSPLE